MKDNLVQTFLYQVVIVLVQLACLACAGFVSCLIADSVATATAIMSLATAGIGFIGWLAWNGASFVVRWD